MTAKKNMPSGYEVENGALVKQPHDFVEVNCAWILEDAWAHNERESYYNVYTPQIVARSHVVYFTVDILIDNIKLVEPCHKPLGDITTGVRESEPSLANFLWGKESVSITENSNVYRKSCITLIEAIDNCMTNRTSKIVYALDSVEEIAEKIREKQEQKARKQDGLECLVVPESKEKDFGDLVLELTARMENLENVIREGQPSKKKSSAPKSSPKR